MVWSSNNPNVATVTTDGRISAVGSGTALITAASGPSNATNVSLTDTLLANITFVSVTKTQGTCSGTATCALGTLSSGATAKVTITIKPKTAGTITYGASVIATEGDLNPGNNSASAVTVVTE